MSKERRMDSIVPQEQSEKCNGTFSIPEEEINFFSHREKTSCISTESTLKTSNGMAKSKSLFGLENAIEWGMGSNRRQRSWPNRGIFLVTSIKSKFTIFLSYAVEYELSPPKAKIRISISAQSQFFGVIFRRITLNYQGVFILSHDAY